MKTKLVALALVLSLCVLGVNTSVYAGSKHSKKADKTLVTDSTKTKTNKMRNSTHHMTHKTTKTHKSSWKSKSDTSKSKMK